MNAKFEQSIFTMVIATLAWSVGTTTVLPQATELKITNLAETEQQRERLVQSVLQQLYTEQYDSALANCLQISQLWPDDPMADILQATIYQTQMRIYRVRIYETQFDSLVEKVLKLSDLQIQKNPTAEMLFMQGMVRGMQALHRFKQGDWSEALKGAVFSLHFMKRALEKDVRFADPKLSLGLYEFWKSQKLDFGFGFRKSNHQNALKLIEEVWKQGRYLSIDAAFALQNILLHEEEYAKALDVNNWLRDRFPNHPSVLYHRALLLERLQRPLEALPQWLGLISQIKSFQVQSDGYLAECYLHCAQIYEITRALAAKRKDINSALQQATFYAERRNESIELESSYQKFNEIYDSIKKMQRRYVLTDLLGDNHGVH